MGRAAVLQTTHRAPLADAEAGDGQRQRRAVEVAWGKGVEKRSLGEVVFMKYRYLLVSFSKQ